MLSWTLTICLLILAKTICQADSNTIRNDTSYEKERNRRSLIFENAGTIKLNIGISQPMCLQDPISWRSLVASWNLQGGHYALPTQTSYPWDKWENTVARSLNEMKSHDDSQLFVYAALEYLLYPQDKTKIGRSCLLQLICRNAQVEENMDIFSEISDIILTPRVKNTDEIYASAYAAGKADADCAKTYNECPRGGHSLSQYLYEF